MELVEAAWDLLLGGACAGCARAGRPWCRGCAGELAVATGGPPQRARVLPAPPGLPVTWSAGAYDGVLRAAVLAFKERGRRHLARPLGAALAGALLAAAPPGAVAVGVPPGRGSRRGYDQVGLLLRAAAGHGGPPSRHLLRWTRATTDQAELGSAERRANRHGALDARPCPGVRVVLVDDVVTTGATLAEAARALRAAGADVVGAATVAATARRWAPGRAG